MKTVALLLILLAVAGPKSKGQEKAPHSGGNHNHAQDKKSVSEPPSTTIIEVENPTAEGQKDRSKNDSKPTLSDMGTYASIGLFFVGVIGIIVAICTLRQLRNQIKLYVLVERGWLKLDMPTVPAYRDNVLGTSFEFTVTNVGKTPVWVVRSGYYCFIGNEQEIPLPIDYSACKPFLAVGETIESNRTTFKETVAPDRNIDLIGFETTRILAKQAFIHLYGFVHYRDTSDNNKREMYFCLRLETSYKLADLDFRDWWVREGPTEANRSE
jgi:hypothetical protein